MDIVLHQFPFSHFNEKARWALDHKQLPHRRVSYLPGPHMRAIKKLSGQTSTPVLVIEEEVTTGSAAIIDRLENLKPGLYPENAELRSAALDMQSMLDRELGPMIRRALFSEMVDEGAYFCRMFADGKSLPARLAYRAAYPMAKGLIKKGNGVTDQASIDKAFAETERLMNLIGERSSATGYLVGDSFTVADLTACALLSPAANPPDCDVTRPEPMPTCVQDFLARWSAHPAIPWVREIYAKHRGTSAVIS